jgi:hypothetical protein
MTTMKQHIEEVYDTKEIAEKNGKEWKHYFGYEYTVEQEEDGRYRLVLDTNQIMMG